MGNVGMLKILREYWCFSVIGYLYNASPIHRQEVKTKKFLESSVNDCMLTNLFISIGLLTFIKYLYCLHGDIIIRGNNWFLFPHKKKQHSFYIDIYNRHNSHQEIENFYWLCLGLNLKFLIHQTKAVTIVSSFIV